MLSREKINELAEEAVEAESVKIPDNTRWWLPEHYDQEFARLIIQEVLKQVNISGESNRECTWKQKTWNLKRKE